jgi:hypothetical protein
MDDAASGPFCALEQEHIQYRAIIDDDWMDEA